MYDYLLGESRNFAADRAAAEQLVRVMPEAVPLQDEDRTRPLVAAFFDSLSDARALFPSAVGAVRIR